MEEQKAVRRVRELNSLTLDVTRKDETIQSFAELLTLITGARFSQVNIFDEETQFTIASDGALFPPLPKKSTFCTYTLDQESTLEIPDMSEDERVKNHFAVEGEPYVRYYFGEPLITKNEVAIGTICIIHDDEIMLSDAQREAVQKIAGHVTKYLEQQNAQVKKDKLIEEHHSSLNKVVHDLRSPISAILGTISMLDLDELDKQIRNTFTLIKKSCTNLTEYINETLDKNIPNKENYTSSFVTAGQLEEKLRSIYDLQAKEKNITLSISHDLESDERITTLSSGDLLNIAGNLVSNAIKFTPKNKSVSVHLEYKDSEKKMYQLDVTDTGKGMNANQVEAIKNHVRATPETGSNNEQGYGIGLHEALQTLRRNEGSFEIETTPGEGTRFSIFFPRKHSES